MQCQSMISVDWLHFFAPLRLCETIFFFVHAKEQISLSADRQAKPQRCLDLRGSPSLREKRRKSRETRGKSAVCG